MTAKNIKEKEMKTEKQNDDYQVILDDRGYYKIKDWYVKIRRINVREMIAGWGIISQAFTQVQPAGYDWQKAESWIMLFLVALPIVPGKFYNFLQTVMELQNTGELTDKQFYEAEDNKYNSYIRKDLKTEELIDVITIIYNQEKTRLGDLAKQVDFILKPLVKALLTEKEQQAKDLQEAQKNGKKPST